ncbi:MAG: hypothetical protein ACYTEX_25750 [Planctomycetota bacterium]
MSSVRVRAGVVGRERAAQVEVSRVEVWGSWVQAFGVRGGERCCGRPRFGSGSIT